MVNAPEIREWLGPIPLIGSIAIGTGSAFLRRLLWRSNSAEANAAASGIVAKNALISVSCAGGTALIALFCGASADTVAMLARLTIVFLMDDIVSRLLRRGPAVF